MKINYCETELVYIFKYQNPGLYKYFKAKLFGSIYRFNKSYINEKSVEYLIVEFCNEVKDKYCYFVVYEEDEEIKIIEELH